MNSPGGNLQRALELLWKQSRFVSYFYQQVHLAFDDSLPTVALMVFRGRITLYCNNSFTENLSPDELIGLLVHEFFHLVLDHDHRAVGRSNPYLTNLAQDMVINSILTAERKTFFSGTRFTRDTIPELKLPPGLPLVPEKFYSDTGSSDPTWEEVYRWLASQKRDHVRAMALGEDISHSSPRSYDVLRDRLHDALFADPYEDDAGYQYLEDVEGMIFQDREGTPLPTGVHVMQDTHIIEEMRSRKEQLFRFAAGESDVLEERAFQSLTGVVKEARKVDTKKWHKHLHSIVDRSSQSLEWTITTSRFNRRYMTQLYLPGRVFRQQERITVAVDVSASMVMKPGTLEEAFGALEGLPGKYRLSLVCIDQELFIPRKEGKVLVQGSSRKPYFYRKGDWKYLRTGMSGTTFFASLFNSYLPGHHEMVIVITDGYVYDLGALKPYHNTLWVTAGQRPDPFLPPFGKVITMKGDEQ